MRKSAPLNFSQKWTDGKLAVYRKDQKWKMFDVRCKVYMMNMLDETSGVEIVNFQSFNLAKYTVSHILILSNKM